MEILQAKIFDFSPHFLEDVHRIALPCPPVATVPVCLHLAPLHYERRHVADAREHLFGVEEKRMLGPAQMLGIACIGVDLL